MYQDDRKQVSIWLFSFCPGVNDENDKDMETEDDRNLVIIWLLSPCCLWRYHLLLMSAFIRKLGSCYVVADALGAHHLDVAKKCILITIQTPIMSYQ